MEERCSGGGREVQREASLCLQLVAVCVMWLGPCGSNHA